MHERPIRVAKPALVAVCFVPIDAPEEGGRAREYVKSLWEGCGRLGMSDRIDRLRLPLELDWPSADTVPDAPRLLAARERPRGGAEVYQALAFAFHDVLAIMAALAPNRAHDSLSTWEALHQEWQASAGAESLPAEAVGAALLFSALCDRADAPSPEFDSVVAASLPGGTSGPPAFLRTETDLFHWEVPDDPRRRRIALLAPPSRERDLNRWIWWDPVQGASALQQGLLSLLLQVLKVRYQHRVYLARSVQLRTRERAVDDALSGLLAFLGGLEQRRADRFPMDELLAAEDRLVQDQAGAGGVLMGMSRLKELRRTVLIAQSNMRALMPHSHSGAAPTLFAGDFEIAAALAEQIDDDLVYADALQERAHEAQRLTGLRIEHASQHHAREQTRLTLFQATLVGSLLAGVGAVNTVKANVDLTERLRLPVVCLLAALVLALPHLIVNWPERYRTLDYAVAAICGAATLWLVARILALPGFLDAVLSVSGALLLAGLIWILEKTVGSRERPWLRQQPEWRWVRAARERLTRGVSVAHR